MPQNLSISFFWGAWGTSAQAGSGSGGSGQRVGVPGAAFANLADRSAVPHTAPLSAPSPGFSTAESLPGPAQMAPLRRGFWGIGQRLVFEWIGFRKAF